MENPGIYLDELQDKLLRNTGTRVGVSTIFQAIRTLGYAALVCSNAEK